MYFDYLVKKSMFFLLCFILFYSPLLLAANYSGGHEIGRIYVNKFGKVSFGTIPHATNTCDHYNFQFKFDSATEGGKSMLTLLLSAKMSKAKIDVWYESSPSPGSDHTNGCTYSNIANISHIGIN